MCSLCSARRALYRAETPRGSLPIADAALARIPESEGNIFQCIRPFGTPKLALALILDVINPERAAARPRPRAAAVERALLGPFAGSSGAPSERGERAAPAPDALDLSDLDLGAIEFSEREVRALSGLTPALSRRLQRQLLASLPPRAAQRLRRTLSLHAPAPDPAPEPAPAPAEPPVACSTLPRPARRSADSPPLLSKYLTPERALSPDEPRAAEGAPRRHSLRAPGEAPRRRPSRFLRSDFFERAPAAADEESAYARHRKEKELETQRILREIRSRRAAGGGAARSLETPPPERTSPLAALLGRERERSGTPLLPSLREAADDADASKLRPRSFPVRAPSADEAEPPAERRESRLLRPRSYPAASPDPPRDAGAPVPEPRDAPAPVGASDPPPEKTDVEVSFSITLPRKRATEAPRTEPPSGEESQGRSDVKTDGEVKSNGTLALRKYRIVNGTSSADKPEPERKARNGVVANGGPPDATKTKEDARPKSIRKDETQKTGDTESAEKKETVKKKVVKKVSSKSKTDLASVPDSGDAKPVKKVTRKVKEKVTDDDTKTAVIKKKSVLQSIGHKLEKFASSKSNSPEKSENTASDAKRSTSKVRRNQRERSEPAAGPPGEARVPARAAPPPGPAPGPGPAPPPGKTTVSKVLGLFRKFEPKDKIKPIMEKSLSLDTADVNISEPKVELDDENSDKDKLRRPTSLLLNGLGRKKYDRTCSDSVANLPADNEQTMRRENDTRNKNNLKLDFSKLPRVKKIVPTNSVIEPLINYSSLDGESEKKYISDKIALALENGNGEDRTALSRSRSRSRSTVSNEVKSDLSADAKFADRPPASPSDSAAHPLRNHEPTSPEKEDIVERIRRKSFYSRFNEKKQRRKSSLVGPGAVEYDPLARILAPPDPPSPAREPSPADLSPSDRYRALLADLPRTNLKYENYGLNDKIDTYRSLDRNDYRKYPGTRSYLDYEPTYGQRYSKTKSLLEPEPTDSLVSLREPLKYNRTISMYSPGNYATYRPKRTHNPAIILKESEKEPSPENILDKIKQRKNFSISVTRKPDRDTKSASRSPVPSKGEGDGTECSEKVD